MKGYKGFGKGLICRGKQYAENTVFEEKNAVICESGMHFCANPFDVLDYYDLVNPGGSFNEFAEVEALAEAKTDDNKKFCTTKLKVGAKLSFGGFVNACVDFILEKTKFDATGTNDGGERNAKIGSSGDSAHIGSSGDCVKIGSSGYSAQIGSSGDCVKIGSSGYSAQIGSSGYCAQIGSSGVPPRLAVPGIASRLAVPGIPPRLIVPEKIPSSVAQDIIPLSKQNRAVGSLFLSGHIAKKKKYMPPCSSRLNMSMVNGSKQIRHINLSTENLLI